MTDGLSQFRHSLNLSSWVSGSVPVAPSVKAFPTAAENAGGGYDGKEDCLSLSLPYANIDELYSYAELSQVGTVEETRFRLNARKSREFGRVSILDEEWDGHLERVCEEIRTKLAP